MTSMRSHLPGRQQYCKQDGIISGLCCMEFKVVCAPQPLFAVIELPLKCTERNCYTMLHGHCLL